MPKRHKRMPAHLWKTTVGGHSAFYCSCRCKSIQRAAVWGTSRKSITGSALFAKSSVRMIVPRSVSKGISVCVPSGAMRTSVLPSSNPAGSAILTRPVGCVRLPAVSKATLRYSPFVRAVTSSAERLPLSGHAVAASIISSCAAFSACPHTGQKVSVSPSAVRKVNFRQSVLPVCAQPCRRQSAL